MNIERSDRRDGWYSHEHRRWGAFLHMADIDATWCEFADYGGRIIAIIETKFRPHGRYWLPPSSTDAKCKALCAIADGVGAAFFVVAYSPETYTFIVQPWNDEARRWFVDGEFLHGEAFVERLWLMRGRPMPESIRAYVRQQQEERQEAS